MKCIRVIEYEAESEDAIVEHLAGALLSRQPVIFPGDHVRWMGPNAPQVSIRLISEKWE